MKFFKLPFFIVLLICCCNVQSCATQTKKINGVSFVAANQKVDATNVAPVLNINANYAAVMPFGFMRHLNYPDIAYNTRGQWFGETTEGSKQYILELRKKGLKIMLKPQIWVWHGEFTGLIDMQNEADWEQFEKSYTKFILEYAKLAQQEDVELFCIGTELERFIEKRNVFWMGLIQKIKTVYKGKLTYAANWDEFKRTPFWTKLDFIGIDAYFPVSEEKTPNVESCLKGWQVHKPVIKELSELHNKPILFTEFGYRSVDYSGKAPWKSDRTMNQVNLEAQTNTTKALFETFWGEKWFAGGFIWKWFINHEDVGGNNNAMFTPQNKPVEQAIAEYYRLY